MNNVIDIQMPSGNFLELGNTSIRLKILNNIFTNVVFPAYYSFPINLPSTPKNQAELGFTNLPESGSNINKVIPVKLFLDGRFFDSCLLNINKFENGFWDINLLSGNEQQLKSLLDKPMRELDFKEFNGYDLDTINRYVVVSFNFSAFTGLSFRLKDPDVSSSFDITYTNFMTGSAQDFIDAVIADINTGTSTHSFTASEYKPIRTNPFNYTAWIVLKSNGSWNKNELDIIGNIPLYAEYTNLQLTPTTIPNWNYYAPISAHMTAITSEEFYPLYKLWFGAFEYRFPVIYNPILNANETTPPLPIINWWHFENKRFEPLYYEMKNYYRYNFDAKTACVKLSRVIEAIGDTLGFKIATKLFEDEEMDSLILISNGIIDYINNTIIDLRLTMPDTSIGQFLTDFKNLFGLAFFFDFNNRVIRVERIKDILLSKLSNDATAKATAVATVENKRKMEGGISLQFTFDSNDAFSQQAVEANGRLLPSVTNFAALPTSGNENFDVRFVDETLMYYTSVINPITGVTIWQPIGRFLRNYKYAAGLNTISIGISPILMYNEITQPQYGYIGSPITFNLLLPALQQPAKIKGQTASENSFAARIAFYRGLQPMGSSTLTYPLASYDKYDFDRNEIGNYTLKFEDAGGLVETHLNQWLDFITNRNYYNTFVKFTGNDIINLDTSVALRLESLNYAIESMDVVFDNVNLSIKPVKVGVYKK